MLMSALHFYGQNSHHEICSKSARPYLIYKLNIEGCTYFGTLPRMRRKAPTLTVSFFRTDAGNEPVREWLTDMPREHRKMIGTDIKTVELGWPIGMPVVRKIEPGLWEVRTNLEDTIARVLFTVSESAMVLLHGFIKKSQKTPSPDLAIARQRKAALERYKK